VSQKKLEEAKAKVKLDTEALADAVQEEMI
jgi:hypothetical protein